jgi:hypothetical protein
MININKVSFWELRDGLESMLNTILTNLEKEQDDLNMCIRRLCTIDNFTTDISDLLSRINKRLITITQNKFRQQAGE